MSGEQRRPSPNLKKALEKLEKADIYVEDLPPDRDTNDWGAVAALAKLEARELLALKSHRLGRLLRQPLNPPIPGMDEGAFRQMVGEQVGLQMFSMSSEGNGLVCPTLVEPVCDDADNVARMPTHDDDEEGEEEETPKAVVDDDYVPVQDKGDEEDQNKPAAKRYKKHELLYADSTKKDESLEAAASQVMNVARMPSAEDSSGSDDEVDEEDDEAYVPPTEDDNRRRAAEDDNRKPAAKKRKVLTVDDERKPAAKKRKVLLHKDGSPKDVDHANCQGWREAKAKVPEAVVVQEPDDEEEDDNKKPEAVENEDERKPAAAKYRHKDGTEKDVDHGLLQGWRDNKLGDKILKCPFCDNGKPMPPKNKDYNKMKCSDPQNNGFTLIDMTYAQLAVQKTPTYSKFRTHVLKCCHTRVIDTNQDHQSNYKREGKLYLEELLPPGWRQRKQKYSSNDTIIQEGPKKGKRNWRHYKEMRDKEVEKKAVADYIASKR